MSLFTIAMPQFEGEWLAYQSSTLVIEGLLVKHEFELIIPGTDWRVIQ